MPNIVKNTTFPGLFDLLAPHSCRGCGRTGKTLCNCCKKNMIKSFSNFHPKINTKNLPPTYFIGERSDSLGKLIHDLKYQSVRAATKPLAEILNETLPKYEGDIIIVPLPTISKHIRTRGLDHTFLIAKKFAKLRGKNYRVERLLLRNQDTVQVGTSKKTRLKQAASAYKINPKTTINPQSTYLLFDDVWTTGASMKAAYKTLSSANIKKINLIILALSTID